MGYIAYGDSGVCKYGDTIRTVTITVSKHP